MQVPPPFATGALTTIIRQASLAPGAAIEANTRSVRKSKYLIPNGLGFTILANRLRPAEILVPGRMRRTTSAVAV